jgi:hypothetical protein
MLIMVIYSAIDDSQARLLEATPLDLDFLVLVGGVLRGPMISFQPLQTLSPVPHLTAASRTCLVLRPGCLGAYPEGFTDYGASRSTSRLLDLSLVSFSSALLAAMLEALVLHHSILAVQIPFKRGSSFA